MAVFRKSYIQKKYCNVTYNSKKERRKEPKWLTMTS